MSQKRHRANTIHTNTLSTWFHRVNTCWWTLDKVADMEVDKVADKKLVDLELDMVVNMEVDKVADIVAD